MPEHIDVGTRVRFTVPAFADPHLSAYHATGERVGTVTAHQWYEPGVGACWCVRTTAGEDICVIEGTWGLSVIPPLPVPAPVSQSTIPDMPSLFGARSFL